MQGDSVTAPLVHMAVETVIRDVECAIGKPFGKGRIRPVENLCEGLVPVQKLPRLLGPKLEAVGRGGLIELGPRNALRHEIGGGIEAAVFLQQALDGRVTHGVFSSAALRLIVIRGDAPRQTSRLGSPQLRYFRSPLATSVTLCRGE